MKFKRIISAAAAVALFLTMASPVSNHGISVVRPELVANAVTYDDATCAQYALRVAELVNQQRASRGTASVTLSEELCLAANVRAKEIKQTFSHQRPDGSQPYTAITGASYTAAAENIAAGQRSPDEVMNDWMNSEGHRNNLLNSKYNFIGVGVHYSNGTYYWVQFFAKSSNMTAADVNPKSGGSGGDGGGGGSGTQKKDISQCEFYMDAVSFTYTGSAITPNIYVVDGSKTLTKGTDYTVSYANNVNAGTATFTVTGKGNYTGSVSGNFTITAPAAKAISTCTVTLSGTSFTYTGVGITPTVTVKDGTKPLTKGTDYTVAYSNNINPGTGTVTVIGKGSYTGSVTREFRIVQKSLSTCTVTLSGSGFAYTGSAIKPGVTVKDGTRTLKSGTDYTLSYTNNVNPGTGKVTVTGKGGYSGSVEKTFTITQSASGFMPGDLNRDKCVDTEDIALLQQYISKWSVNIDTRAADVTGDGVINDYDLARLQQYVSRWNVQLVSA